MTPSDNNHNNENPEPIRAPKRGDEGEQEAKKRKRIKQKDLHKVDHHPWWIALPHFLLKSSIYIFITLLCCIGLLWVKLQHGPLDLEFARDKIEQALSNKEAGYAVTLEKAELIWAEFDKPLYVRAHDVIFNHEDGTELDVETTVVGVSPFYLIQGKVRPTYVQIMGPTIQLVEQDGQLSLFWKNQDDLNKPVEDTSVNPRDVRKNIQGFLTALFDKKLKGVYKNLQTLDRIVLNNIIVNLKSEDRVNEALGMFNLDLQKSENALSGTLNLNLPEIDGRSAKVTSLISYREQEKDLTFAANVYDLQNAYLKPFLDQDHLVFKQKAIVQGEIMAALNDELRLSRVQANVILKEGRFSFPDLTSEAIEVPQIDLKANLDRAEKTITIESLSGTIEDIPFEVIAQGRLTKGQVSAPFTIKTAGGEIEKIKPFFPEKEIPSTAEKWLTQKLSKGRLKDIEVSGEFTATRNIETGERIRSVSDIKASFSFEEMTVQFSEKLPPATNADGRGTYADGTLNVVAEKANIGSIVSDNVVVDIANIGQYGKVKGEVQVKANGPLSGLFAFLSSDPINLDQKLPFKGSDTKGVINANVNITFPVKSDLTRNDFTITADGTVKDAMLPNVIRGLPLTSSLMNVELKNNVVNVKGKGQLAQRPIDVTYQQAINNGKDFKSKVTGSITADEGLRQAFDIDLSSILTGPVPINFNYIDQGSVAKVNVNGVLGPTILKVDEFNYMKPAGVPGTIGFQAILQNKKLVELDQLKINAEGLNIDQGRILFSSNDNKVNVSRGSFPNFQLGKTNTNVDFEVMPNNTLKIVVKGSIVDASAYFKEKKEDLADKAEIKDTQPKQISITVDQLILKDDNIARNVIGYFEVDKAGDATRAEMDAQIGKSKTVLRFKPDENTGLRDLFLEASDAGDFFRALGLYKNIQGGKLQIYGQPLKANSDDIIGRARIDNFKAQNAPILAKLVNALSLPGLVGLINNEGVTFSRLESKFEWQFRPQGDLIVLKDGRTSGTSLGLTFEGIVDRASKTTDISGTAIPASELNKMIGSIPLVGQILTGGDALLAATYTIKGPSREPNVIVNPLSVLAPGIIRKILFEESVESKVKKAE